MTLQLNQFTGKLVDICPIYLTFLTDTCVYRSTMHKIIEIKLQYKKSFCGLTRTFTFFMLLFFSLLTLPSFTLFFFLLIISICMASRVIVFRKIDFYFILFLLILHCSIGMYLRILVNCLFLYLRYLDLKEIWTCVWHRDSQHKQILGICHRKKLY